MIRKAAVLDLNSIMQITKACAKHMINQQIFQWNEHYPNRNAFKNDVQRGELYVYMQNNICIGCIVITTIKDVEYVPIEWLTKDKNIYIHRLAVHPKYQGKGIAQHMMTFAENYAKTNGYFSVRLDTFSQNKRNQKFYETRGYKRLGNIYFPKQSKHAFYCYELVF
jgi:ribosomal protein S18 acetylase RimI-like enzyme